MCKKRWVNVYINSHNMVNFAGVEIHNFGKPFLCELTLNEIMELF